MDMGCRQQISNSRPWPLECEGHHSRRTERTPSRTTAVQKHPLEPIDGLSVIAVKDAMSWKFVHRGLQCGNSSNRSEG